MPTNDTAPGNKVEYLRLIETRLKAFRSGALNDNTAKLLNALGYTSEKTLGYELGTAADLLELANRQDFFSHKKARPEEWLSVDFLFQWTDEDVRNYGQAASAFDSKRLDVNSDTQIETYIFFAIELKPKDEGYSRTALADITREINRLFPMPALVLFKHDDTLTLSVINRRLHKRDAARDVLEKVTFIKGIRVENPHRAHVEILYDLAFPRLAAVYKVTNFVELHDAWRKTLDISDLNKRFYKDLANWYFWAREQVKFPAQPGVADEANRATNVIRLITRLTFVWFLKERGLVPDDLFRREHLASVLTDLSPKTSTFYKAILQNLFFVTLNTPMDDVANPREFRKDKDVGKRYNDQYMVHNQYRHKKLFRDPDAALRVFASVPFLNGGLFECLDKREEVGGKTIETRVDGFSDIERKQPAVPNRLFFCDEHDCADDGVDLNAVYGTTRKSYKVRGLIDMLDRYKFTIAENTPIDEEVALDPELLGKVFENLLASYNPETGATARKQTGSFYTPREIVGYMVDESLIAYLETRLASPEGESLNARLRQLFAYTDEKPRFTEAEVGKLIKAIDEVKILDPACGSGAYPMGILGKLVFILARLDPQNAEWKEAQLRRVDVDECKARELNDEDARDSALAELQRNRDNIEEAFTRNEPDYGRKLFLIENCIYGVDIQPIAIQISKLRFFISLIIDQRIRPDAENLGIRPLPNLETKFVAANTLLGIEKPAQGLLQNEELRHAIEEKERELKIVRERHFTARTTRTKEKYRKEDERMRREIGKLLKEDNWSPEMTAKLVKWNPYDQNTSADFFDAEWMFGLIQGFNVVIANPPYIDSEMMTRTQPSERQMYSQIFQTARGNWDMFVIFIEKGLNLLASDGVITYIVPNKLVGATYTVTLRELFLKYTIQELRDYSEVNVFKDADVYPTVFVVRKSSYRRNVAMTVMENLEEVGTSNKINPELFYSDVLWDRYFVDPELLSIVVKCSCHKRLSLFLGNIVGAATVGEAYEFKNSVREYTGKEKKQFKKLINTGTIDPFASLWGKQATRYLKDSYTAPIFFDEDIKAVSPRRYEQSNREKIIIGGMTRELECFYDEGEYLAGKSTTIILGDDKQNLKYFAGVLNSLLISFWYKIYYKSLTLAGGYLRIGNNEIKTIPVPDVRKPQQAPVVKFVDEIIAAKRKDPNADTGELEREIDQLVYRLYDLNEDEIAIVEASARR